jgi:type VII secretion integral membrane protein EccD
VTTPVGVVLAKVTIATPHRRIDVALPEDVPLAELLGNVIRHAGEGVADAGERHGGWALRRATGVVLEAARPLNVQGVRDGEVLHLVPGRAEWPELEYDDVVEAIAAGARRYGRSWGKVATRRCALAVLSGAMLVGLVDVLLSRPPLTLPGGVALATAVVLAIVGITLARAVADASAGAVVAACGLPFAFVGGVIVAAPTHATLTRLGAPHLLLGSAALLAASVAGYVGVGTVARLFTAGMMAGGLGILAGLLGLTSMSTDGVAAVVLTVALGLLPGYPLLSVRLGRLPVPELPQRPEDMLKDQPRPERSAVFAAVARADEILTGLLIGVALVSVPCTLLLVAGGHLSGLVLVFIAVVALLLRSRLFPTPRQRIPLLVAGLLALTVPVLVLAAVAVGNATRMVILLLVVIAAAFVMIAGLLYSRRAPSPYMGRFADIFDVLAIIALVPTAAIVAGLYSYIQDLFSSVV